MDALTWEKMSRVSATHFPSLPMSQVTITPTSPVSMLILRADACHAGFPLYAIVQHLGWFSTNIPAGGQKQVLDENVPSDPSGAWSTDWRYRAYYVSLQP